MTEHVSVEIGGKFPQVNVINSQTYQSKTNETMAAGEKKISNLHMSEGFKLNIDHQKKISPGKSISY